MAITLPDDIRARMLESIKRYVAEYLDQDIGDLRAGILLEFVVALARMRPADRGARP